jgi:Flp pilus assembly protein TadB
MGHRPTLEQSAAEHEVIPPVRAEARPRAGTSRVWISFNQRGSDRTYVASSGALAIILSLVFGILMIATFVVVFATLLVWIVVASVFITLLCLVALFLRRFRLHRWAPK